MKQWREFMKKYYPDGNLIDNLQRLRLRRGETMRAGAASSAATT